MDLCAEHDAREEREEKSLEDTKQGEDEGKGAGHDGVTVLEVLTDAAKEEPGDHRQTKHRHGHDVELQWRRGQ